MSKFTWGKGSIKFDKPKLAANARPRSLYVYRPVLNGEEIRAHFKKQGFGDMTPDDEMHVTVAYSKTPVDWMKIGQDWAFTTDNEGKLRVGPGGPRMCERFGKDGECIVLLFASSDLNWRHQSMCENGASWDWPEYQPHITLTYSGGDINLEEVEPFDGEIEFGPEVFQEIVEGWSDTLKENRRVEVIQERARGSGNRKRGAARKRPSAASRKGKHRGNKRTGRNKR
jgi:hypothetical protein